MLDPSVEAAAAAAAFAAAGQAKWGHCATKKNRSFFLVGKQDSLSGLVGAWYPYVSNNNVREFYSFDLNFGNFTVLT